MIGLLRSLRAPKDQELFYTHTAWAYPPGKIVKRNGDDYVVTRVKSTSSTLLISGGSAPCWVVYGRLA